MKRVISMITVVFLTGFGTFFSSLKQAFQIKEETTAPPPTTTAVPYERPEGVHAAAAGRGKMVALTFDDGPGGDVTNHIMGKLRQVGGHATFFCLGERAACYQKTLQRMAAQGHEVASHSYSHEHLTRLSESQLRKDLSDAAGALEEFSGQQPLLLRPPYGAINDHMLERTDWPVILWSIDSEDWRYCELLCKNRSEEQRQRDFLKVVNSVLDYVRDGDIILMHDLYSFTQDVADVVIDELHHQGWKLVTVSELFAAKGIVPQPGVAYHRAGVRGQETENRRQEMRFPCLLIPDP